MVSSSINTYRKDKKKAEQKGDLKEVANMCNTLGYELQENGDLESALDEHKEELRIYIILKDQSGVAIAYRRLGEVYSEMNEWNKALDYQAKYLTLAKETGDLVQEQRAYATLGRTHYQYAESIISDSDEDTEKQMNALKESEKTFLRALTICDKLKDKVDGLELSKMRCRVYHNLALVLDMKGERSEAINFIQQSLQLSNEYGMLDDAYRSYTELSKMYFQLGNIEMSLKNAKEALRYAQKLQKKNFIIESYSQLGFIYANNDDFLAAKKYYYKAWKMKHSFLEIRESHEKSLKIIVNICLCKDLLSKNINDADIIINYEKLGDYCSKLSLHSKAIYFYKKTLEKSLECNKDKKYIASIYTSLAQTYVDIQEYKDAIIYYNKELEIQKESNPKEAIVTLIEIARLVENNYKNHDKTSGEYYEQALQLANGPKLELYVIKCYLGSICISKEKRELLDRRMENLVETYGIDAESELSCEEELDTDSVDLNMIEFSDSDEEFQERKAINKRRQSRSIKIKRTNTGDTPLHLASIKGNINMVKKLLEQKHAVNIRDNSGWLPIHEACNWGHLEIVELLIDAGAHINDRGGKECLGITPLHDAACNGHLGIIALLLNKGASLLIKDDKGKTALDHLIHYTEITEMSSDEYEKCKEMQNTLLIRMEREGYQVPERVKKKVTDKMIIPMTDDLPNLLDDDDYLPHIKNDDEVDQLDYENNDGYTLNRPKFVKEKYISGEKAYKNAIISVGSHSKMPELSAEENSVNKDALEQPLIHEDNYVEDDWLIDDLGLMSRKRKRPEKCEFEYKERSRKVSPLRSPFRKKKSRQPKISSMIDKVDNSNPQQYDDDHFDIFDHISNDCSNLNGNINNKQSNCLNNMHAITDEMNNFSINRLTPDVQILNQNANVIHSPPLRLHIKILNKKLLVPISASAKSNQISWLEEEISRRYMQQTGVKVKLKLTTSKDEELNPLDIIDLAISTDDSELRATVIEVKDIPPLHTRYTQSCYKLGISEYTDIVTCMRDAESTGILDFSNCFLRNEKDLQPIFAAIQHQNLQVIKLNSTRIDEVNFNLLLESLTIMPLIQRLEAEACSLTSEYLQKFNELIIQDTKFLNKLSYLNLSYNDFYETKFCIIQNLLSLPSLNVLTIQSCDLHLTTNSIDVEFSTPVKKLEMDNNEINVECLNIILERCPNLTELSISGSIIANKNRISLSSSPVFGLSKEAIRIGSCIDTLMSRDSECILQYLDLSRCDVRDEDIDILISYLHRCVSLSYLNLSYNVNISETSLFRLLQEINNNLNIPLKTLALHGLSKITGSNLDIYILLSKLMDRKSLISLSVPKSYNEETSLSKKWTSKDKAAVMYLFEQVFFTIKI